MGVKLNALISALNIALQALMQASDLVPGKAKLYVTIAQFALQALIGVLQAFYNPDGTPAKLPYKGISSVHMSGGTGLIIFGLLLVSAAAIAQTSVRPGNISGPALAGGSVLVITPQGRAAIAEMDGLGLAMENGKLMLRVAQQPAPQIRERVLSFRPTAVQTAFSLSEAPTGGLAVHLNGLMLTDPDDYSASGSTVTLVSAGAAHPGDIVQIRYRY